MIEKNLGSSTIGKRIAPAGIVVSLVLGFLALSCNKEGGRGAITEGSAASRSLTAATLGDTQGGPVLAAMWNERKLIKTGVVRIEVSSVDRAIQAIRSLARTHSGLVSDAEITKDGEGHFQATLTLQVPSEHFDDCLQAFRGIGEVKNESAKTSDVTKSYFDLETRLRVKRQTEERLRGILATRTAELSQVLEAERELERVVTQIEEMEGAKKFYDQQIAVSTIAIELTEPVAIIRAGAFSTARKALRDSLDLMASSLTLLLYVTFVLLPWVAAASVMAFVFVVLKKFLRRRKAVPT